MEFDVGWDSVLGGELRYIKHFLFEPGRHFNAAVTLSTTSRLGSSHLALVQEYCIVVCHPPQHQHHDSLEGQFSALRLTSKAVMDAVDWESVSKERWSGSTAIMRNRCLFHAFLIVASPLQAEKQQASV